MSEFSDLLSRYISEKNIKVYSLLKYCNLDRSTMYQIINGKRNPSSKEVFDKIAEFLHLTPSEHQRFEEAYLISKIGAETYYSRIMTFCLTFFQVFVLPALFALSRPSASAAHSRQPKITSCTALLI